MGKTPSKGPRAPGGPTGKDGEAGGLAALVRRRPVLLAVTAAAASLLSAALAYLYYHRQATAAPCTVELLISSSDGRQRVILRPRGGEEATGAEFEGDTRIHRVELRHCR